MMMSPNDSVIICDSPSSDAAISTKQTENASSTNYRKRLRSCRDKQTNLLNTVYESPLAHLTRNILQNSVVNVDADVSVVSAPLSKRRKISPARNAGDLDRSVVVINDTTPDAFLEIGASDADANDVVEVSPLVKTPKFKGRRKKSKSASPIKKLAADKRVRRARRKRETRGENKRASVKLVGRLGANDENDDGQIMDKSSGGDNRREQTASAETEDIEVVWVSDASSKSTRRQTRVSTEQPFVIDTEPTLENLEKIVLARTKKVKRLQSAVKKMRLQVKNHERSRNFNVRSNKPCSVTNGQEKSLEHKKNLREIVIDGCNVAMGHKPGYGFSEKALQIVINYFKERGHAVKVFLPQDMRCRKRELLEKLHASGHIVFTPSRKIGGKKITPYDDRYILEYATRCNGIVVSSDQYRDLWHEKPEWRDTIENRLLTPTFVGDYLMFPEDPLGRTGPKLEEFLRH